MGAKLAGTSPQGTIPYRPMTFYPSSELLLEPAPLAISRNRGAMLARGVAKGALAARAARPLAFLVPGLGQAAGVLSIATTAYDAWNLFQGGDPAPFEPVTVPYPPQSASQAWEARAVYFLETQTPGIPSRTNDTGYVPFDGRVVSFEIESFGSGGRNVRISIIQPNGTPSEVNLGGNNEVFKPLVMISFEIRPRGSVVPFLPYPNPQIDPGTDPGTLDVPINIEMPGVPPSQPYPLAIPARLQRPGQLGDRPVPVIYDPTLPEDQRRTLPQAFITPTGVQIGRGGQSDPVTISADSIADLIDLLDQASDYRLRVPPAVTTCTPEPEPPGDCCSCDDIRQIVFEELDEKFLPRRPNVLRTTSLAASGSGAIVLPSYSQWIELRIVTPPPNVRSQSGGANSPSVQYNGWVSFGATESASERIPFHYNVASFPVPQGASGFSWLVYDGGTAAVTVGYLEET